MSELPPYDDAGFPPRICYPAISALSPAYAVPLECLLTNRLSLKSEVKFVSKLRLETFLSCDSTSMASAGLKNS